MASRAPSSRSSGSRSSNSSSSSRFRAPSSRSSGSRSSNSSSSSRNSNYASNAVRAAVAASKAAGDPGGGIGSGYNASTNTQNYTRGTSGSTASPTPTSNKSNNSNYNLSNADKASILSGNYTPNVVNQAKKSPTSGYIDNSGSTSNWGPGNSDYDRMIQVQKERAVGSALEGARPSSGDIYNVSGSNYIYTPSGWNATNEPAMYNWNGSSLTATPTPAYQQKQDQIKVAQQLEFEKQQKALQEALKANMITAPIELGNQYQGLSAGEMAEQARVFAEEMYAPQLQAIIKSLEDYKTQAQQSDLQIDANYANLEPTINRMIEEERARAQEAAIARGAGDSGVADYLMSEAAKPLMESLTQAYSQRAADKSSLQVALQNATKQAADQIDSVKAQMANTMQTYLNNMSNTERQNLYNWAKDQLQYQMNAENNALQQQLALLPYLSDTVAGNNANQLAWSQVLGQVTESPYDKPANSTTSLTPTAQANTEVGLRDYASKAGKSVSWDPATGGIKIGNKVVSKDALENTYGAISRNGTYYLSQSNAQRLLAGV